MKRVLSLVDQAPLDGADARDHQLVLLKADDERVARNSPMQ